MIADRTLEGDLPVRVHYPAKLASPAPIIVFSHGLGGSRLGYEFLGKAWSSRGYVVVLPSHRENVPPGVVEQERHSVSDLRAMKEAINDPANWPKRPLDIRRTVDALENLPAQIRALSGKLDLSRIGVGGHSYGAYTALLCAGAQVRIEDHWRTFPEERARAFLALSPPGNGSRGLSAESWTTIHAPLLCMTGTLDLGVLGEPATWREDAYNSLRAPGAGLVVLDGGDHFTFSAGRPRFPADPLLMRQTELATLWFWDKHLRGVDAPFPDLPGARVEFK